LIDVAPEAPAPADAGAAPPAVVRLPSAAQDDVATQIATARPVDSDTAAPVAAALAGLQTRLLFGPDSKEPSAAALSQIERVAEQIGPNGPVLTVHGFSGAEDGDQARRDALSRATNVREALRARGLDPAKLRVLIQGATLADGPADRVDILVKP